MQYVDRAVPVIKQVIALTLLAAVVATTDARAQDAYYDRPNRPIVFHASDPSAELQHYIHGRWTSLCSAPCTVSVWVGGTYRVGGDDTTGSRNFTVPEGSNAMTLNADAGSVGVRTLGFITIAGGGLALLAGTFALVYRPSFDGGGESGRTAEIGLIALGAAVATVGIGIVLSSSTTLHFGPDAAVGASPRVRLGKSMTITPEGLAF